MIDDFDRFSGATPTSATPNAQFREQVAPAGAAGKRNVVNNMFNF